MEAQKSNKDPQTDEIDLGQLFRYIGRGFNSFFRWFIRLFLYLKKNAIKLGVLVLVGLIIGVALGYFVERMYKIEVIVKPNLESKTYLYDVIEEINSNVKSKDTVFFNKIGVSLQDLEGFVVLVEPIEKEMAEDLSDDIKYLELLEKFRDEAGILEVVRNEITDKSTLTHRITFQFINPEKGREITALLMQYINSNEYYSELLELHNLNAKERIKQNDQLLAQIDNVILAYSVNMSKEENAEGTIVFRDKETVNVTNLLKLKNEIIRDTELKKLELQGNKQAVRIVNFGNSQSADKNLFKNTIISVPVLFILLFLLVDFIRYLNRKASELQLQ